MPFLCPEGWTSVPQTRRMARLASRLGVRHTTNTPSTRHASCTQRHRKRLSVAVELQMKEEQKEILHIEIAHWRAPPASKMRHDTVSSPFGDCEREPWGIHRACRSCLRVGRRLKRWGVFIVTWMAYGACPLRASRKHRTPVLRSTAVARVVQVSANTSGNDSASLTSRTYSLLPPLHRDGDVAINGCMAFIRDRPACRIEHKLPPSVGAGESGAGVVLWVIVREHDHLFHSPPSMDDKSSAADEFTSNSAFRQPASGSHSSGMFSGVQNLTVTGQTLTNITNNSYTTVPFVPSDFRMVPLGDIDLQQEIRFNDSTGIVYRPRLSPTGTAGRSSSHILEAKTPLWPSIRPGAEEHLNSPAEVATGYSEIYGGSASVKQSFNCLLLPLNGRPSQPNLIQICGAANHGGLHATLFHDGETFRFRDIFIVNASIRFDPLRTFLGPPNFSSLKRPLRTQIFGNL
ncbi:hypothetical protein B0H19DRAFT_1071053 [Mycena capillaripes]|nr:hypothetical protein B0H19DRAFT_1071053 [Mycena capillaripes]